VEAWRRVENPHNREAMTFIETAEETGGHRVVLLVDLEPGGGPAVHSHQQQETFELVFGDVEISHDDVRRPLELGESLTVPGGELHGFTNVGDEPAQVKVTVVPPGDFERTMRVLCGMGRDGRMGPMGEPPSEPALVAAALQASDLYMPPIPRPVWRLMIKALAPLGQKAYREALEHYDRPHPSPGERVGELSG